MSETIRISVVICTYNREKYIRKTLNSIAEQSLSYDAFELVVVNNNSMDATTSLVEAFIRDNPQMQILFCNEPNQGLSFARNRGIAESQADVITFLDDDAIAPVDFLEKALELFYQTSDTLAIGGKIIPEFVDGKPNWYSSFFWGVTGQFDPGHTAGHILYWGKFPCGSNMTFHKKFFEKYGMFNTNLGRKGVVLIAGEEKELFSRVKEHADKRRVWYYPELLVYHMVDNTKLNAAYIKKFSYGFALGEKLEVAQAPFFKKLTRYIEYTLKPIAAMGVAFFYLTTGRSAKAGMLFRFAWWIVDGIWSRNK